MLENVLEKARPNDEAPLAFVEAIARRLSRTPKPRASRGTLTHKTVGHRLRPDFALPSGLRTHHPVRPFNT